MNRQRTLDTNGIRLQVTEAGEGPLVLLLHGFPESSHSWRHQLRALSEAGYHAVAPNQRGYGHSDRPHAIEAYDVVTLVDDAIGLIDTLGEKQAVVVGHDWGAPVAWNAALLHPDRVRAVAGMSVPYGGRPQGSPLAAFRAIFKDIFFYMLYFQEPGVAEAELEADVRRSLRTFYYSASGDAPAGGGTGPHPNTAKVLDTMRDCTTLPPWLTEADLDAFTEAFEHSGFRGPLNWYRNFDRSWKRTAALADRKIEQPATFIAGDRDPVIAMGRRQLERLPKIAPRLFESLLLPGCGHWVQQERPEEVNAALLRFLRTLD
jgi:pimeloyl-ACP methyl ester carboxylesterase